MNGTTRLKAIIITTYLAMSVFLCLLLVVSPLLLMISGSVVILMLLNDIIKIVLQTQDHTGTRR